MKIAVIGSGVSGLGCSWLLSTTLEGAQVTIYEKGDYLGGHTNTVDIKDKKISVDTGFIVYNELNYPNLKALFKHLDVETQASDMSFALSVQTNTGKDLLEWGSDGFRTLFAQKSNLFSPSFWRMVREILRFGNEAPQILHNPQYDNVTMGQYLDKHGYSQSFRDNYILPMTSAIWSTPCGGMLDFPAQTLVHFMHNHQMLQLSNRPRWRTVTNGSREYVKKIHQVLKERKVDIRLSNGVTSVRRQTNASGKTIVVVTDSQGKVEEYDQVVFACHGSTANEILKDQSEEEKAFLSVFKYSPNRAYLHSDESLMPKRKEVWSAWNYIKVNNGSSHKSNGNASGDEPQLVLSYWMNRLQTFIPSDFPLFVTLNPHKEPAKDKTYSVIDYEHPIYVPECVKAQEKLQKNQGKSNTYFCGAYCGFGFHEDGLISGLQVAEKIGAKCPWTVDTSRYDTAPIPKQAPSTLSRFILPFTVLALGIIIFKLYV